VYRREHGVPVEAWTAIHELIPTPVDLCNQPGLVYCYPAIIEFANGIPPRLCYKCTIEKPLRRRNAQRPAAKSAIATPRRTRRLPSAPALANFFNTIEGIVCSKLIQRFTIKSNLGALPSPDQTEQICDPSVVFDQPAMDVKLKPDFLAGLIGCYVQTTKFSQSVEPSADDWECGRCASGE
jgi:hypothetical protein